MIPHKPTLTLRVVLSAALLLSVACLSGCATGKEDAGGAAVVVGMGTLRAARMAGATVNVAAVLYLSKHRDARPLFVAAEHALALLRGNTNAMPADLALALAELPMLRDGNGAVFVSALTPLVWNEVRQMVTAIERQAGLQEFIRSLDDALISALLFTAK